MDGARLVVEKGLNGGEEKNDGQKQLKKEYKVVDVKTPSLERVESLIVNARVVVTLEKGMLFITSDCVNEQILACTIQNNADPHCHRQPP